MTRAVKPLAERMEALENRQKSDVRVLVAKIDQLDQRVGRVEGMMKSADVLASMID